MIIPANVYGIDFLGAYPDPQLLIDRGVRFVAIYLKNWRADWVDQYRALGGAVVPIMEVTANQASLGAAQGVKDALKGVQQAQTARIPADNTVPIIYTQDSSAWSATHVQYFVAAEPIVRAHGFLFGGYGGRKVFDDCARAGVTWDVIWATNAWSWLGGRHPDRHVTQGGHGNVNWWNATMYTGTNLDVSGMGNIDTNRSNRPFPAWGPDVIAPPVDPLEDSVKTEAAPTRVLDTRPMGTPVAAGQVLTVPFFANEVEVVIHVVAPATNGYLVAWGNDPRPPISQLDFAAGVNSTCVARAVLDHGILKITPSAACHIVVDLIAVG